MTIEVKNIDYRKGSFSLSCDSISIEDSLVTGIIGKNGSGKSTLLRIMQGYLKPGNGKVSIDGKPISSYTLRELSRRVAFVQQEIPDPLGFTVREVMSVSGYSNGQDEMRMMQSLGELGITHLVDRRFSELSGGERRLVTLAAAIYQDSRITLLDEPTTFLDVDREIAVHKLIAGLREKGRTVVAVMHDLGAIYRIADRVILMRGGRVIDQGETGSVMTAENLARTYDVEFDILETPYGREFRGIRQIRL